MRREAWRKPARLICKVIFLAKFATSILAQTYTVFDVPGAVATYPVGINNRGDVTGSFFDTQGFAHGFVRDSNGNLALFDGTPTAINDAGVVTGCLGNTECFLRDGTGDITLFDVPQIFGPHETVVGQLAIDNSGQIAGWIGCAPACSEFLYAFIRDKNGVITTFFLAPQGLTATSINAGGDITGINKALFHLRGFVGDRNGEITLFDAPGASGPPLCGFPITSPVSINNNGDVAGSFSCAVNNGGFIRMRNGTFEVFGGFPVSINEPGDVVGFGLPDATGTHDFVRDNKGNVTVFDAGTPTSINDRDDVTGYFFDATGTHAFVRSSH